MPLRPVIALMLSAPLVVGAADAAGPDLDFNRDVRPLLARNCFACHGPDDEHREAGLRLDRRDAATGRLDSGETAVIPGRPEESELYRRITSEEEALRMPPADSGHKLTAEQTAVLRRWIEQGAPYAEHWSSVKPVRPRLPEVGDTSWPRNGIDHFILARLEREGLSPMPEADRYALVRRLSLDLRGLPPTPREVREFVNDDAPDAYEKLVERFLNDPAFGERWARMWLDLARYADSAGYGSDPLRPHVWRYRDWVIDAFNRNLPFDRFTLEQIAGDLLPGAGETEEERLERLVATAFHRNTMTNTEGGTDDEEFRVAAVKDRVNTTLLVWMGLTMGCAQCHNHKYEPISQREYYRFFAFFNQTADADRPDESPTLPAPSRRMREETQRIDARIAGLRRKLDAPDPQLAAEQARWEEALRGATAEGIAGRFVRIELPGPGRMLSLAEVQVFSGDENAALAGTATQSSTDYDGPARLAIDGDTNGHYFEARSTTHTRIEADPWWEVDLGQSRQVERIVLWNRTDGGLHTRLANFRVLVLDADRTEALRVEIAEPPDPSREISASGPRSAVPEEILAIVDRPADRRTEEQQAQLAAHFRTVAPSLQPLRDEIARLEKSRPAPPPVPVMQELPAEQRRPTHVMVKGNFLDKGEPVEPGVPAALHPFPEEAPPDRLGVARWLVDPDNPLTARVTVNRFWSQVFGVGLVETEEDFGTQGELPSHPELLDWLAVEFMGERGASAPWSAGESLPAPVDGRDHSGRTTDQGADAPRSPGGWDIKALLRLIVTSATYRQSSQVTPERLEADPQNRLLARAPRFRLEAELVRDQALALAGLLSRKTHGPSVYPPQPDGLWQAAFNGERTWPTSQGEDRYRRGLYTFWRRTVPYPSMAAFDAPSREICSVRRIRTNTPLQSFVTLNDPVYVEASQALARRIVAEGGKSPEERAAWALRLGLVRPPRPDQVAALVELYQSELEHFRDDPQAALLLATDPLGPLPEGADAADLAAWTVVANVLLNLDGALTKG